MSFVRKIVGPDERFIGKAPIHWIYAVKGFAWILGLIGLAWFFQSMLIYLFGASDLTLALGRYMFWVGAALGVTLSFFYFLMWIATEVGLTDKRIIFKRGLIFVDVKEVDLEEIKAAEVDNGILGTIFNYGYVFFDARFIENVSLPAIADPYRFVKALNEARSEIKRDSMHSILNNREGEEYRRQDQENYREREQEREYKLSEPRYDAGMSDPLAGVDSNIPKTSKALQKPNVIVFPRSLQEKKEALRKRMKNTFARKTHEKTD